MGSDKDSETLPGSADASGGNSSEADGTQLPSPPGFDVVDGRYAKWHPGDEGDGYYERITNFRLC